MMYRHRQRLKSAVAVPIYYGWVVIVAGLLFRFGVGLEEFLRILGTMLIPLAIVTVFFLGLRSLLVSVTASHVELAYFFGWPRKRIERAEIVSVETLLIPWWYGLGIRPTPKGWMWKVWGRGGVLLTLSNGKGFLIGTDDPDGLASALASG